MLRHAVHNAIRGPLRGLHVDVLVETSGQTVVCFVRRNTLRYFWFFTWYIGDLSLGFLHSPRYDVMSLIRPQKQKRAEIMKITEAEEINEATETGLNQKSKELKDK